MEPRRAVRGRLVQPGAPRMVRLRVALARELYAVEKPDETEGAGGCARTAQRAAHTVASISGSFGSVFM
jgi:hypothetical protein